MTWLSLLLFLYLAIAAMVLAEGLTDRASGRLPITVTVTNIVLTALCAPALVLLIVGALVVAARSVLP